MNDHQGPLQEKKVLFHSVTFPQHCTMLMLNLGPLEFSSQSTLISTRLHIIFNFLLGFKFVILTQFF